MVVLLTFQPLSQLEAKTQTLLLSHTSMHARTHALIYPPETKQELQQKGANNNLLLVIILFKWRQITTCPPPADHVQKELHQLWFRSAHCCSTCDVEAEGGHQIHEKLATLLLEFLNVLNVITASKHTYTHTCTHKHEMNSHDSNSQAISYDTKKF